MTAPVASGWNDGRVGLAATGKAPPYYGAHPTRTFRVVSPKIRAWPWAEGERRIARCDAAGAVAISSLGSILPGLEEMPRGSGRDFGDR